MINIDILELVKNPCTVVLTDGEKHENMLIVTSVTAEGKSGFYNPATKKLLVVVDAHIKYMQFDNVESS